MISERAALSAASSVPAADGDGKHSSSSLSATSNWPPPRLPVPFLRRRSIERFLVIFPRYADRRSGMCGGIEFHARIYVSFTHSSESSSEERMP